MKVIIDDREHGLFEQCRVLLDAQTKTSYVQLSKDTLPIGDILFTTDEDKPVLLVERKAFADLLASIKDGRYEEQSYRLLHASEFPPHSIYYLIEGMFSTLRNPADKSIILSAITSLSFFKGFSVYRTSTIQETAEWLIHTANKIEREFGKGQLPYYLRESARTTNVEEQTDVVVAPYCSVVKKVKKENVTPENIGEIVLCQIPGISSTNAVALMKTFGTLPALMEAIRVDPGRLENLKLESGRKINKSSIENIKKYLS
jgi:crossover junction endonuclease MUS81